MQTFKKSQGGFGQGLQIIGDTTGLHTLRSQVLKKTLVPCPETSEMTQFLHVVSKKIKLHREPG